MALTSVQSKLSQRLRFSLISPILAQCFNSKTDHSHYNYLKPLDLKTLPPALDNQSFAHMLRYSPFIALGSFRGRKVVGYITEVVASDLYIEFGGKFHCVCTRPETAADRYVRGAEVIVEIKDLEMTSQFMKDQLATTLLEADAVLIGLRTSGEEFRRRQEFSQKEPPKSKDRFTAAVENILTETE